MTRPLLYMARAFATSEGRLDGYQLTGPDRTGRDGEVRAMAVAGTGTGKVDAAVMNRFPALEIIAKFGVGYDSIDALKGAGGRLMVVHGMETAGSRAQTRPAGSRPSKTAMAQKPRALRASSC